MALYQPGRRLRRKCHISEVLSDVGSDSESRWVTGAKWLAQAVASLPLYPLLKSHTIPTLVAGLFLEGVGTALIGAFWAPWTLIGARAVHGIGAAMASIAGLSLISASGEHMGAGLAAMAGGAGLGLPVGSIAVYFGEKPGLLCFLAVACLVNAVVALFLLPSQPANQTYDAIDEPSPSIIPHIQLERLCRPKTPESRSLILVLSSLLFLATLAPALLSTSTSPLSEISASDPGWTLGLCLGGLGVLLSGIAVALIVHKKRERLVIPVACLGLMVEGACLAAAIVGNVSLQATLAVIGTGALGLAAAGGVIGAKESGPGALAFLSTAACLPLGIGPLWFSKEVWALPAVGLSQLVGGLLTLAAWKLSLA